MNSWAKAIICSVAVQQYAAAQYIDLTFNPGTGLQNGSAKVFANLPDGRIIIGGDFSAYNGTMRRSVARLEADGTLDTTFDPMEGPNGSVSWVFPQPDGKLIIVGDFTAFNSLPRQLITRLRVDGSVDLSFPVIAPNGSFSTAASQPDGRILVAGSFTQINGTNRVNLARLNSNGTLDLSFMAPSGVAGRVNGLIPSQGGTTLAYGNFTSIGGVMRPMLARLNDNGTVDTNFALPLVNGTEITAALEQPDGKIVIAGYFTSIDGYSRLRVARLNSDGSLDFSFYTPLGVTDPPYFLSGQADGKTLLGGSFFYVGGVAQLYLARLNANGTFDPTFNPVLNGGPSAIRGQSDGTVLLSGGFSRVNGTNINRIVRLTGDATVPPQSSLLSARLYPAVFVQGTTGINYRVEYVNNLTNAGMWTPLTNLTLTTSPYLLLDTTWTNSRQRFYRALTLP